MNDQLSVIIIKGSQKKVLDTINKDFGFVSQPKKQIKLTKKEKRTYIHKKKLTSVQRHE